VTFMVLGALAVAAGTSLAEERTPGERLRVAGRVLLTCAAAIIAGGWAMRVVVG